MTGYNTNSETKTRRVANLLPIIANYLRSGKNSSVLRDWPRVIDPVANVAKQPVTPAEEFFVSLVISHTSSVVYEAIKDKLLTKQEGLRRDVGLFFSLPVPKAVWQRTKLLQNLDFAAVIESSLKNLFQQTMAF